MAIVCRCRVFRRVAGINVLRVRVPTSLSDMRRDSVICTGCGRGDGGEAWAWRDVF